MELIPYGEFRPTAAVLADLRLVMAYVALVAGAVIVAWVFAEAAHASGYRSRLIARFVRFLTRPVSRLTRPL